MLLSTFHPGGRLKKRALRGILPQLAGRRGSGGFFHRTQAAVAARTLGELVAKNAVDDPQLVDDPEASAFGKIVQGSVFPFSSFSPPRSGQLKGGRT